MVGDRVRADRELARVVAVAARKVGQDLEIPVGQGCADRDCGAVGALDGYVQLADTSQVALSMLAVPNLTTSPP